MSDLRLSLFIISQRQLRTESMHLLQCLLRLLGVPDAILLRLLLRRFLDASVGPFQHGAIYRCWRGAWR